MSCGVGGVACVECQLGESCVAGVCTRPAGDLCSTAIALAAGTTSNQSLLGFANDLHSSNRCSGFEPDRVYSVTVPADRQLVVTATSSAAIKLSVFSTAASCAVGSACVAPSSGSAGSTVRWSNNSAAPTQVFLVAESMSTTATFSLLVSFEPTPVGDRCATATTLLAGGAFNGTLANYGNDYSPPTSGTACHPGSTGPDRVFSFWAPTAQRISFSVLGMGARPVPTVNIIEGTASACAASPLVCVAQAGLDDGFPTTTFVNAGPARNLYAIVEDRGGDPEFELSYQATTPIADDTCVTATSTLLGDGGVRTGQSMFSFTTDYPVGANSAAGAPTNQGDRVYRATLPAGHVMRAYVTRGATYSYVPTLVGDVASCEAFGSRALAQATSDFGSRLDVSYVNDSTTSQEVHLIVNGRRGTSDTFTVGSTISRAVPGEGCGSAVPMVAGVHANQTLSVLTHSYAFKDPSCAPNFRSSRVDAAYSIDVPAGRTLRATVMPTTASQFSQPIVSLVDGSSPANCRYDAVCLAANASGTAGVPAVAGWANTTATSKRVYVVVGEFLGSSMAFSLTLELL